MCACPWGWSRPVIQNRLQAALIYWGPVLSSFRSSKAAPAGQQLAHPTLPWLSCTRGCWPADSSEWPPKVHPTCSRCLASPVCILPLQCTATPRLMQGTKRCPQRSPPAVVVTQLIPPLPAQNTTQTWYQRQHLIVLKCNPCFKHVSISTHWIQVPRYLRVSFGAPLAKPCLVQPCAGIDDRSYNGKTNPSEIQTEILGKKDHQHGVVG